MFHSVTVAIVIMAGVDLDDRDALAAIALAAS
jgi:hypothetical protein